MKNDIIIFTPFYRIAHRKDLYEDTQAIFYLLSEFPKEEKVLIVHTYMHGFRNVWKYFFKVLPIKKTSDKYIYQDIYNNSVLFFEFLFLVPKSIRTLKYFSKKYVGILEDYCTKQDFSPNIIVFHFPTYYVDFYKELSPDSPQKIAIIHSFDVKNIKKRENSEYWKGYFANFEKIGFRSYSIKKEFENLIGTDYKSFMCLSGIPKSYLHREKKKKNYNLYNEISLLYAGRLDKNKNVEKSVKVLAEIKQSIKYSFNIIGDGKEKENITNFIKKKKLSDSIKLKGKLNRKKTFEYMQQADIFVMISKKETLGLVYLEAMAAGCIVIGTRGQGIDGVIIDGWNGFLTDSENENEISKTLIKVMNLTPNDQEEIRKNALETVQELIDTNLSKEYYSNITWKMQEDNIQ